LKRRKVFIFNSDISRTRIFQKNIFFTWLGQSPRGITFNLNSVEPLESAQHSSYLTNIKDVVWYHGSKRRKRIHDKKKKIRKWKKNMSYYLL